MIEVLEKDFHPLKWMAIFLENFAPLKIQRYCGIQFSIIVE